METAIQKAVKEGWTQKGVGVATCPTEDDRVYTLGRRLDYSKALLDPTFWQALGRAMGWGNSLWIGNMQQLVGDKLEKHQWELQQWEYHWHHFIDYLAEGKSPDDFFNNLFTQK